MPGGNTLSFDIDLEGRQVPDSWSTWSGGNEPRVLYTLGQFSVAGNFGNGLYAFGLEAEPNSFSVFNMVLRLDQQNALLQAVDGDAGAKFFGFISDNPIMGFDLFVDGEDEDFAFGRMVVASEVPVPGALWLLGSGLIALVGFRKKLR